MSKTGHRIYRRLKKAVVCAQLRSAPRCHAEVLRSISPTMCSQMSSLMQPLALVEPLEPRQLLTAVLPSNNEQLLLELTNRARANPTAEAKRYGIALNEGLLAGTISKSPKQPLAFNPFLIDAARIHSQDMLDNDFFDHPGSDGSMPQDRMASSGYFFDPTKSRGNGENIAWQGTYPTTPNQANVTFELHKGLFVDKGIEHRGHRLNILNPSFREVGMGTLSGIFTANSQDYNSVMITEDFAYVENGAFLTGVAYTDRKKDDDFYTPGEGIRVNISAKRKSDNAVFTTKSWASGGYSLKLPPGAYTVTASGTPLGTTLTYQVVIANKNVKLDIVKPGTADLTPPIAFLNASALTSTGKASYTFQVFYDDNGTVKTSSIGNGDVLVTGPGYSQLATLFSRTPVSNSSSVIATYRIPAPSGQWNSADNSIYTVKLVSRQVTDTAGRSAAAGILGTFVVNIPAAAPVTALASAQSPDSANAESASITAELFESRASVLT